MKEVKHMINAVMLIIVITITIYLFLIAASANITKPQPSQIQIDGGSQTTVTYKAGGSSGGQQIFQSNCATCHALDKVITGPALRGVNERGPWTERANLHKWVHNPGAFIPTTPYTQELQKTYGQIMPSFPQLSDKDIDAIFDYIKNVPSSPTVVMD